MDIEEFLEDLYRTELEFQIDKTEVDFIRTGIETLIQIIADLMWKHAYRCIENETENILKKYPELRISRNGKYAMSDVIKAGSFYEQTKNVYPDQFDYIFLMCVFESRYIVRNESDFEHNPSELHNIFRDILLSSDLAFPSLDEKDKFICFDRYLVRKGPASKLRFIYGHNDKKRHIYVDLVPAFKVLVLPESDINIDACEITGFKDVIKRTSSIILVQGHVSYVESELFFMKNILSLNHIKAYRILKYILNGSYNDEHNRNKKKSGFLSVFAKSTPRIVPSYHMKRVVISHHYECISDDCENVAPCLLKMLENIKDVKCIMSVRNLYELFLERPFTLVGYRTALLDNMVTAFKEMQQGYPQPNVIERKKSRELQVKPLSRNKNSTATHGERSEQKQCEKHVQIEQDNKDVLFLAIPLLNKSSNVNDSKNYIDRPLQHKKSQKDPSTSDNVSDEQPLLNNTREKDFRNDNMQPNRFNSQTFNILPVGQPIIANPNKSSQRADKTKQSASLDEHETPLDRTAALEIVDNRERTKASDWIKTLTTYMSNLILIAVSVFFAIIVLFVLSYRS